MATTSTTNPAEERVAAMIRVASSRMVSSVSWIFDVAGSTKTLNLSQKLRLKIYRIERLNGIHEIQKQSLEVFYMQKGVLRNFTKFTGKHLCQSLFFNKVAGPRSATLLKKRLWHRCFPMNLAKFLRTPFLQNTSGWLLLKISRFCYLNSRRLKQIV